MNWSCHQLQSCYHRDACSATHYTNELEESNTSQNSAVDEQYKKRIRRDNSVRVKRIRLVRQLLFNGQKETDKPSPTGVPRFPVTVVSHATDLGQLPDVHQFLPTHGKA